MARALALGGLALVVAGSFGPWLRSGERRRSSYELFHAADRLGFLGGAGSVLPRVWVFVPLLSAAAFACAVAGRPRLAAAIGAIVGLGAIVIAGGVLAAPVVAEWGPRTVAAGGACSLIGAAAVVFTHPASKIGESP